MTFSKHKIICIGLPKTGTSTMGDALLQLGYSVVGARLDLTGAMMSKNIAEIAKVAEEYDALQDIPWAFIYRELDVLFPESKFIFTDRDPDKWIISMRKHFKGQKRDFNEWFYGKSIVDGNENIFIAKYMEHKQGVMDYFAHRPHDLLVMSFENGDGWDKLCEFLDKPAPRAKFPHSNKGQHSKTFSERMVDALRRLLPVWLRKWRIEMMIWLGFPDMRNRFNNKLENEEFRTRKLR
jgi:hypothetical protein